MQADPLDALLALVESSSFVKLVLSKPAATAGDLARVTVRPIVLKGEARLSFVYTHATRDITKNLPTDAALVTLRELLTERFAHAHLFAEHEELQLLTSRKGKRTLLRHKAASVAAEPRAAHDREKHRCVDQNQPFLTALGVTNDQHQIVPAMARKWKQINKFVEVLDHALAATALKQSPRVDVVDFGSGKGYLTFATHAHLRETLGLNAHTAGVELRPDLVALCNDAAQSLAIDGLRFEQGDVSSVVPPKIDIMIALHACDTATDHAIHTGLRAGAAIIMCSPCCHKELRPQLLSPHPLRPILKHGVHLGQQAEMITDGLRAMLLEACGYDAQVFEFVSLEHTNKNKMILAIKRAQQQPTQEADAVWRQIADIKAFYGVRDQCLEQLLRGAAETMTATPDTA